MWHLILHVEMYRTTCITPHFANLHFSIREGTDKACRPHSATSSALLQLAMDGNNAADARTQEVPVLEIEVQAQPLTPYFFSTRTRDISASVSSAIHSTILRAGLLDESGFLQDDPR